MTMHDVKELEEKTKVSRHTWRTWIREGKIPVYRLGRTVRVSEEDLIKFLAANRDAGVR